MKKFWAIACVVGFTGFWVYGFIALSGVFGERNTSPMVYILCLLGLFVGALGWKKVMEFAPRPNAKRPAARARLDAEAEKNAT
ncbi:MAG: hypothetical protein AAGH83_10380 [Pseudomonadota bacterium]